MSHPGHFQYKCTKCGKICGGCRCMEPGKETRPTVCEDCDPHLNPPAPTPEAADTAPAVQVGYLQNLIASIGQRLTKAPWKDKGHHCDSRVIVSAVLDMIRAARKANPHAFEPAPASPADLREAVALAVTDYSAGGEDISHTVDRILSLVHPQAPKAGGRHLTPRESVLALRLCEAVTRYIAADGSITEVKMAEAAEAMQKALDEAERSALSAPEAPSVPQGEGDQLDVGYFRRRLKSLAEIVDKVTPKELAEQLGRLMNMTGKGAGSAIASPVGGDDAGSRSALPDASRQELLAQTLLNIARDYDARWRGKEGRGPIPLAELHPGGQRYWREKAALIEAALGASPRPAKGFPEPEQSTDGPQDGAGGVG